jgi:SAM-dependent methyltransferase
VVDQLKEGVTKVHVFGRQLAAARGRLLDVGCGVGETMRFVPDGLTVTGIDLAPVHCAKARAAGEHAVCGDLAMPLPFRAGVFDAALCSDTFEHLVDPLGLLSEIHRVLRPAGLLLCHVPNEFSYKSLRQVLRGDGICNRNFFPGTEEWEYPHLRFFSHRGFTRMLTVGGFTVEEDLTDFGRGWRRRLYPLFGSGPSLCARKAAR